MANDLTLTAQAVLNINDRLSTVEKGGSAGGGTGGDTGGGSTSGLVPDSDQIYTNRYQLYTGTTDAAKPSTIQLNMDYLVSDALGLMITLQMQRTDINTGNKGKTSILPVVNGSAKLTGSYVIKANLPYLVAAKDVLTKQPLSIDLTGIGESLGNAIVPPKLTITYGGDHNVTVTPTEGHDYDDQQNGALYDPQITRIIAFDIGARPQMLPVGKIIWSGASDTKPITLDATAEPDFSNIPNGLTVSFNVDKLYVLYVNGVALSQPTLNISKDDLIVGNVVSWFPEGLDFRFSQSIPLDKSVIPKVKVAKQQLDFTNFYLSALTGAASNTHPATYQDQTLTVSKITVY